MSNTVIDCTSSLAVQGGEPLIKTSVKRFNTIGESEISAVTKVLKSGNLSQFLGAWHDDFYGGPCVQSLEKEWSTYFKIKHSVAVNSNTSGLIAALGAIGIEPYDEVIVSTWTMCASATSILVWNAIPVFADIEPDTFTLSPESIEKLISKKTKAIIVPDIFGQAADLKRIMGIAKKYGLKVIEDAAQAPGALYHDQYVGTIADIGIFSLNYHKHIHCGEGGVCVTNDDDLAERMRLIRNHAEAVVGPKETKNLSNMIGFNFRMTEIEAAIAAEQLKKLENLVTLKQTQAAQLNDGLSSLSGLITPTVRRGCTHAYYVYAIKLNIELLGVDRHTILNALKAEGVSPLSEGYTNIHTLPLYQKKTAYGSKGFPWVSEQNSSVEYHQGICPIAEELHNRTYIGFGICLYDFKENDINNIIAAFHKVWDNLNNLKTIPVE